MAVDEAGMKTAFDALDASAASAPMSASAYNTERAKIIADGIRSGDVDPDGGPPPLTAPAGGGPVTGTGKIL